MGEEGTAAAAASLIRQPVARSIPLAHSTTGVPGRNRSVHALVRRHVAVLACISDMQRAILGANGFGDVPRTEVLFADTVDQVGPYGAKSMSESPYNPVAAALGNAIANATGIRFTATPFKPDRLWPLLHEKFGK